jgi:hypothetical protein
VEHEHLISLFQEHIQPHLDALSSLNAVARLEDVRIRLWPAYGPGWLRQLGRLLRPSQAPRQQLETQVWFMTQADPTSRPPQVERRGELAQPAIFWATSSLEATIRILRERGFQYCAAWTPLSEPEIAKAAVAAAYLYEYVDPGEGRMKELTRRVVLRTLDPSTPRRLVVQGARRPRDPARPGDPDLLLGERDTVVDLDAPEATAQIDAALERIVGSGWDQYEVMW